MTLKDIYYALKKIKSGPKADIQDGRQDGCQNGRQNIIIP